MPTGLLDIPIQLVNLALMAVISLPFVVTACSLYIAHKSVRPGWALYHMHKRWETESSKHGHQKPLEVRHTAAD